MRNKKDSDISTVKRYWNIIRNGLFIFGIRNRLANIGLDINPYYWVQEDVEECEEPIIKGESSEYHLKHLGLEELTSMNRHHEIYNFNELIEGIKNGQQCIGLEHNGEIATYMVIELNDFTYNKKTFKFKEHEAYLMRMWTFHSFRNKNLAPYLRYQSYQLLKKQGIATKYSITQYFNKSSIKFKRKLNSKHLKLYLNIVLFKKFYWTFLIREYK